jgi:hypothetical protein
MRPVGNNTYICSCNSQNQTENDISTDMLISDPESLCLQSANRNSKTDTKVEEAKSGETVMKDLECRCDMLLVLRTMSATSFASTQVS